MPIALVLIGIILIVTAFNNTMGQLFRELRQDVPGFFVWIVAIAAIGVLGYIPGWRTPSRWLLALVALVVVLVNYKAMLQGFGLFAASGGQPGGQVAANPATAFPSSPAAPQPTPAQVAGTAPQTQPTAAAPSTLGGLFNTLLGAATSGTVPSVGTIAGALGLPSIGQGGVIRN